jgi:hypothetical protein
VVRVPGAATTLPAGLRERISGLGGGGASQHPRNVVEIASQYALSRELFAVTNGIVTHC